MPKKTRAWQDEDGSDKAYGFRSAFQQPGDASPLTLAVSLSAWWREEPRRAQGFAFPSHNGFAVPGLNWPNRPRPGVPILWAADIRHRL